MRCCASLRTSASWTRSLTPSVSVGSAIRWAWIVSELRQHVRQVQLALRVVGRELVQRVEQRLAVERVDPGVDLADLELLGRRVPLAALGLDDLLDVAVSSRITRPY